MSDTAIEALRYSEFPNSSDCISRQESIEEWKNDFKGYVNALNIPRDDYNGIMAYIDELPSAQPEPIKINIEDFNKEDWERLKKEWGNTPITVLSAQPEIIRCRDCKFWTHIKRAKRYWCKTDDGLYDLNTSADDFCSRAERRTDDADVNT